MMGMTGESERPRITEAAAEAMCDRIVQRRIPTDSAWRNAADYGEQVVREDQITDEVWTDIESRYEIGGA